MSFLTPVCPGSCSTTNLIITNILVYLNHSGEAKKGNCFPWDFQDFGDYS